MDNNKLQKSYFPALQDRTTKKITIGEALKDTALKYGDIEALVEVKQDGKIGRRCNYKNLYKESLKLAFALSTRFKKGEHVVIWSPNNPEWILIEYAAALSGIVLVTANPALKEKELRYIIENSHAVALFLVPEFRGNPMMDIGKKSVLDNKAIREIVNILDYDALFYNTTKNVTLPNVQPDDAAQIQYTSGTTGFPKGAMLSHLGLINNAYFYSKRCGITKDSTWVNIMPLFHTSGCGMVTLGCLNSSCRMVLISLFDANTVLNTLANFKADIILGVPTMILSLLEVQETHPRNIDNLKVVSCGGSNVDPDMVLRVQKAFGCKFSTLYGQTEYCPVITQHHLTDTIDDICKTIGQPIDQTEVSIQSVEEKTILPIGKVGEICARGPSKMLQYYNNAEATNQTMDQDGWLHTGDLGMMDERGYIKISGRVKEMIIRGGENHFPAEIENVLRQHSQILDIAIVGMPDKKYGEIIVAFVKFRNKSLLSGELKKFSRQEMSPQKTPSIWIEVDQFPLTGSGKIQKFKLIEKFKKGYYKEIA